MANFKQIIKGADGPGPDRGADGPPGASWPADLHVPARATRATSGPGPSPNFGRALKVHLEGGE